MSRKKDKADVYTDRFFTQKDIRKFLGNRSLDVKEVARYFGASNDKILSLIVPGSGLKTGTWIKVAGN
jgi:hypothetical protein